jgi:hypothetical protein
MVVTTSYHSRLVRKAAENVGIPAVTLTVNSEVVETMQRRLRESGVTIVAAEAEFGNRMRAMYTDLIERPEQLRVVLADDAAAVAALDPREPVMLTRAARARLGESALPNAVAADRARDPGPRDPPQRGGVRLRLPRHGRHRRRVAWPQSRTKRRHGAVSLRASVVSRHRVSHTDTDRKAEGVLCASLRRARCAKLVPGKSEGPGVSPGPLSTTIPPAVTG